MPVLSVKQRWSGATRGRRGSPLPFCPFVNGYIQRHPEDVDLIPEAHRDEFGL